MHDTLTGYDFTVDKPFTRQRAIRVKCLECCGTSNEVKHCAITDCALWPYRLGKGVNQSLDGDPAATVTKARSEKQREHAARMAENLKRPFPGKEVSENAAPPIPNHGSAS